MTITLLEKKKRKKKKNSQFTSEAYRGEGKVQSQSNNRDEQSCGSHKEKLWPKSKLYTCKHAIAVMHIRSGLRPKRACSLTEAIISQMPLRASECVCMCVTVLSVSVVPEWEVEADIFKLKHPLISPAPVSHYWELVQSGISVSQQGLRQQIIQEVDPLRIDAKQRRFLFINVT